MSSPLVKWITGNQPCGFGSSWDISLNEPVDLHAPLRWKSNKIVGRTFTAEDMRSVGPVSELEGISPFHEMGRGSVCLANGVWGDISGHTEEQYQSYSQQYQRGQGQLLQWCRLRWWEEEQMSNKNFCVWISTWPHDVGVVTNLENKSSNFYPKSHLICLLNALRNYILLCFFILFY